MAGTTNDGEGCVVGDVDMFDGILEEVTVEGVLGDDNSKDRSYGAVGGGGVGGFGCLLNLTFLSR